MGNKDEEDEDEFTERYIRWQSIRIEQMGFVNNLVVGLSSGVLLWQCQTLLTDCIDAKIRVWFITSCILLLLSVIVGCLLAYNRLHDFRLTAKIVRSLDKYPPSKRTTSTKAKDLYTKARQERTAWRATTKVLGKVTWILLPIQLTTFILGLISVAIAIL